MSANSTDKFMIQLEQKQKNSRSDKLHFTGVIDFGKQVARHENLFREENLDKRFRLDYNSTQISSNANVSAIDFNKTQSRDLLSEDVKSLSSIDTIPTKKIDPRSI